MSSIKKVAYSLAIGAMINHQALGSSNIKQGVRNLLSDDASVSTPSMTSNGDGSVAFADELEEMENFLDQEKSFAVLDKETEMLQGLHDIIDTNVPKIKESLKNVIQLIKNFEHEFAEESKPGMISLLTLWSTLREIFGDEAISEEMIDDVIAKMQSQPEAAATDESKAVVTEENAAKEAKAKFEGTVSNIQAAKEGVAKRAVETKTDDVDKQKADKSDVEAQKGADGADAEKNSDETKVKKAT